MKIAFIGQKGIPAIFGGVEKHTEELATRMVKQGHDVFIYARDNYTDKNLREYKGIKIIHLPSVSTKHLDAISHTFLSTIHALFQPYDVIHYHAIGPTSLCWIIKLLKRNSVLISTFHCQDYFHQKWGKLARAYLRLGEVIACKVPDVTIAVSKKLAQHAKKKYQTDVVVIPNGAKVVFNDNTNHLSQWNLDSKKYILTVGRLINHKGVHYIIEAFKRLENAKKIPDNLKLVIVGEGFYTDQYTKYLKSISKNRPNIVFAGTQKGEVLEQLFSHARLFVQASESEGLSIALLEAMGYGLPVILSDIPENIEAAGGTGIIFQSKNVDNLMEKITYLLDNPAEAVAIGSRAKQRIESVYNWDIIAKQTLELYNGEFFKKRIAYAGKKIET